MIDQAENLGPQICQRITALRERQHMSLQALADQSGLTVSYISKIESSMKCPPVPTLAKIAFALNVHVSYFFKDENGETDISLIKADERPKVVGQLQSFGYIYHSLVKWKKSPLMVPLVIDVAYNDKPDELPSNTHDGEEMIYIFEGEIFFYHGDNRYVMSAGDCAYFNANLPHYSVNKNKDKPAKVLTVLAMRRPSV